MSNVFLRNRRVGYITLRQSGFLNNEEGFYIFDILLEYQPISYLRVTNSRTQAPPSFPRSSLAPGEE